MQRLEQGRWTGLCSTLKMLLEFLVIWRAVLCLSWVSCPFLLGWHNQAGRHKHLRIMIKRFPHVFLFTILISLFFATAKAQVPETTNAQTARSPVSVSFQAGLSLATVSPEEYADEAGVDYGYQSGLNVRASVFLPFSGLLGTQLGVGWVQKGSVITVRFSDIDGDFSSNLRTGYLQFPLLLSLMPTSVFHILVGPVVSFPLSCSIESMGYSVDCDENDLELNTDISIMAGAGVSIPLSSSFSLLLDAVYDLGLTETAEDTDSKNRGFLFTAGIRLPLNR
jgi:hypothetical protein